MSKHGGKRPNSGRKKGKETVVIGYRIPAKWKDKIKEEADKFISNLIFKLREKQVPETVPEIKEKEEVKPIAYNKVHILNQIRIEESKKCPPYLSKATFDKTLFFLCFFFSFFLFVCFLLLSLR